MALEMQPAERATVKDNAMDYGKSGVAKGAKNTPRHNEPTGDCKNPYARPAPKAELLARMKAAAAAKKAG